MRLHRELQHNWFRYCLLLTFFPLLAILVLLQLDFFRVAIQNIYWLLALLSFFLFVIGLFFLLTYVEHLNKSKAKGNDSSASKVYSHDFYSIANIFLNAGWISVVYILMLLYLVNLQVTMSFVSGAFLLVGVVSGQYIAGSIITAD